MTKRITITLTQDQAKWLYKLLTEAQMKNYQEDKFTWRIMGIINTALVEADE